MSSPAPLHTPIAFIIFNRPALTRRSFAEIRRARPPALYVIADGPRTDRSGEAEQVAAARAIIDEVDWPCAVHRLFADENMGCGKRIASGLDWVFSQVPEAIVLEDDCIPAPSFFPYCDALLERYRDDTRVVHIGGNNFQAGHTRTPYSYFFSKYNHISGWATWRRAWRHFDWALSSWPQVRAEGWLEHICDDPLECRHWTGIFDWYHRARPNVWGYAWTYACFLHGLSSYPSVPLVSHVGAGPDAANHRAALPHDNLPTQDLWELAHPPVVARHRAADRYTFDHVFGGHALRQSQRNGHSLLTRGRRKVLTWLRAR